MGYAGDHRSDCVGRRAKGIALPKTIYAADRIAVGGAKADEKSRVAESGVFAGET
jgi:hypothetical protein